MESHLVETESHDNYCYYFSNYEDATSDLRDWGADMLGAFGADLRVLIPNPSVFLPGASYDLYQALPEERTGFENSPILYSKSIKNQVEVDGMVRTHLRDAYAVCKFFAEIENDIVYNGADDWTELSASARST